MTGAALEQADREVDDMVAGLVRDYHPHLQIIGARVTVLFARAEDHESGILVPALKDKRRRILAKAAVIPYRWRAHGCADAEIQVCALAWDERSDSERRQLALLDHELAHLDLALDMNGKPQWDRLGRPRLDTVPHDAEFGWLALVAYRWGEDSVEVEQARELLERYGRTFFPFMRGKLIEPPPHPYWNDDRLASLELQVRKHRERWAGVVDARARFRPQEAPQAPEEHAQP